MCLAPGQTIEPFSASDNTKLDGWVLIFHPDLIRKSALGKKMNEYTFFSYDSHEALHLSDMERAMDILREIIDKKELTHADLAMLIDKIVVCECEGERLDIEVVWNTQFLVVSE